MSLLKSISGLSLQWQTFEAMPKLALRERRHDRVPTTYWALDCHDRKVKFHIPCSEQASNLADTR